MTSFSFLGNHSASLPAGRFLLRLRASGFCFDLPSSWDSDEKPVAIPVDITSLDELLVLPLFCCSSIDTPICSDSDVWARP